MNYPTQKDRARVWQIVDDLGGPTAVALALHDNANAVRNWQVRGDVPRRHWPKLRKMGISLERLTGVK